MENKGEPIKQPDHRLRVYESIVQLVASPENPTPLVRINKMRTKENFKIYVKLERYNPFGSIKDRIALEMLKGLDRGDKTVVEPTSGNTGIALAGIANSLDIPLEIAIPDKIPEEKKLLLKFLGINTREADDSLCPLFPTEGARGLVNALVKSPATRDKYISPNQYESELNVLAHYRNTGPEIWNQTGGKIQFFFAGTGTCGTVTGIGKYLKEKKPEIKIIAVEPAAQEHKLAGMKRITGLSEEFAPKILDRSIIDEIISVSDENAYRTAIELARKEGIMVGPTTGAILFAALEFGESNEGLAVAISPDDAFKYASFYRDFLEQEAAKSGIKELDLSQLVCPLSKIQASEFLDHLMPGETAKILVGDTDSLKSVAQASKSRGFMLDFKQESESLFVVTVKK